MPHLVNYARRNRDNGNAFNAELLTAPASSLEDDLIAAIDGG